MPWTARHGTPRGSCRYTSSYTFRPEDIGRVVLLAAFAEVDVGWADAGSGSMPMGLSPQAHVVKARTEPGYRAENAGHVIVGHTVWYSTPQCYIVGSTATVAPARGTTQPAATTPAVATPSQGVGTRPADTTLPAVGESCGPAHTCGAHAQCRGACPPPGPCASVVCVCVDGFAGDGYTCTPASTPTAATTLGTTPPDGSPEPTTDSAATAVGKDGTWDCVMSRCLALSGVCAQDTECNTRLLGQVQAGAAVSLPDDLSDPALRAAVPLLHCADAACGTALLALLPARITTATVLDDATGGAPDDSVDGAQTRTVAIAALFAVALLVAGVVTVMLYRRRSTAYTLVLTEKFNPMWSVDDEVEVESDAESYDGASSMGGGSNHFGGGSNFSGAPASSDNLEEYYEWSMQADDAAGMAAAIGEPAAPL